jgi:hypothetical protein
MAVKNVVGFMGAGGVGKTVVMSKVSAMLTDIGFPHIIVSSIVRAYYAEHNLSNEKSYLALDGATKLTFQTGLLKRFVDNVTNLSVKNPDKILLCDRSAYDHFAYTCSFGDEQSFSLEKYRSMLPMLVDYNKILAKLFYFPYPVSWTKDIDPDPFRYAPASKNIILDAVSFKYANHYLGDRIHHITDDSVAIRALWIFQFIKSYGNNHMNYDISYF